MSDRERFIERQRVLGDFGELALKSQDLEEILTEACRLVGRALGTDLAKVMEISPDGRKLAVRAGSGWKPGIVGETTISLSDQTSEAYAIEQGEPVVVANIDNDGRFVFPDFMRDAGVVAMVNVPIRVPGGGAYGLLEVDSLQERDFDQSDIEFLRTYAMILGPVIDRLHKVYSLQTALDRNERLLRELEHRIKNNIGVISSLVRTRSREAASDETRKALQTVEARVDTLRLVHEQLYASGEVEKLGLRPYLSNLVEGLHELHHEASADVKLKVEIADVEIATDRAMPIGLIVNECVTNSFKYAFGDKGGEIAVSIEPLGDGHLRLLIADNGKGFAASSSDEHRGTGMDLVKGLSRQVGGEAEIRSSDTGTSLVVVFPAR